jgi:hypothetical protein
MTSHVPVVDPNNAQCGPMVMLSALIRQLAEGKTESNLGS